MFNDLTKIYRQDRAIVRRALNTLYIFFFIETAVKILSKRNVFL
jgi:hypothetical protein